MEIITFDTLEQVEAAAKSNYEGTTDIAAMHDSLVAVVCDIDGFRYYEGYSMGGQMVLCSREQAQEIIAAY